MIRTKLLAPCLGLYLISTAVVAADQSPHGYLARNLIGSTLEDQGILISGWGQAGLIFNDNDTNDVSKQGFFNGDEGFNLNQLALAVEKKVASNVVSRATPTPAPMPNSFDWGFNVTAIYGNDANFFKTYGWDDDLGVNDPQNGNEEAFNVAQAYLEFYLPVLGGSNLMLGLFHTPLINEIGFPLPSPAPTEFYTHTYSFMHGPAKHAGALYSFKLPHEKGGNIWGFELGAVQGWNNIQDPNDDIDVIANLRWRSSDMSLWIDWENIYGNGANDSFAECGCGSPYPTATAPGENATRYQTYLTISKPINATNRLALEMSYGEQEKSALSTAVNNGVPTDADWYGANVSWFNQMSDTTSWNSRFEYFNGDDPANVVLTGANIGKAPLEWSSGEFYALTSNITWFPSPAVRVRSELRYDMQQSSGPDAFADGTEDDQVIASLDMTVYF